MDNELNSDLNYIMITSPSSADEDLLSIIEGESQLLILPLPLAMLVQEKAARRQKCLRYSPYLM